MCFFITKCILFSHNLLWWIVGICVLITGIALVSNAQGVLDRSPAHLGIIPILVIVTGVIMTAITCCGWCGVIDESRCLLLTYAIIMLFLVGTSSYLTHRILGNLEALPTLVADWMDETFERSIKTSKTEFTIIESAFKCCGARGFASYTNLSLKAPPTCCPLPAEDSCSIHLAYKGCAELVGEYLKKDGYGLKATIITIIVIEVIAMMMALYLVWAVTRQYRDRRERARVARERNRWF